MSPQELAWYLLDELNWQIGLKPGGRNNFHPGNYIHGLDYLDTPFKGDQLREVQSAVLEAWGWLAGNGLLAPMGETGWYFVTRLGQSLRTEQDFERFRRIQEIPRALFHPKLADKVWLTFLRGDLETAVFQSFKEVEVAVRDAAGLPEALYGTELMRKAFDARSGALRDPDQPDSEREALAHLFAGAIGSYKNPHSHRRVAVDDPSEAAEMILLASHLLRIVDARKKTRADEA
jgi:uncharacterized protein (TIGR02391 family)